MSEEKKPDTEIDEAAAAEDVKRQFAVARREREKAGGLIGLQRSHIVFVLFLLIVSVLGVVYIFNLSYQIAAIIGGAMAMVMVVGLLMSTKKNGGPKSD